jgi:hypothetical protein
MIVLPTELELATTTSSVLADTAFVMTELDADEPPQGAGWVHAAVGFRAALGGRLVLSMQEGTATQAAADMLCTEPGDPEASKQAAGAVLELANVLTSVVIARVFGSDAKWKFGIPERLTECPAAGENELSYSATLRTDALERVRVLLLLGEGVGA